MSAAGTAARSLRRHALVGGVALALLVGGLGGWAATSRFAGAVVAPGTVVVESNVKMVQHPTGGIVGELLVKDGDRVREGEVLVRLDETVTRANLAAVSKALDELSARAARLAAERDDAPEIAFPDTLSSRAGDAEVAGILAGERRLFDLRRSAREGQKAQLAERVGQLEEEIGGLAGEAEAKAREVALIQTELQGVRKLWSQKLIPISRVTALEREAVRLDGERNQLIATTAQTKGKIAETRLQSLQIDQDLRSEVAKELREVQAKSAELAEQKVAAEDRLKRVDIRAPGAGIVDRLAVHTVGGVIGAGDTLMVIVPESDELTVDAKIAPSSIDQVSAGQAARIRFSAFNRRTTPEIEGRVTRVSADVTQDPKSGASFYTARIALPEAARARLNGLKLLPGMPAEAFIRTDLRSVLSYLVAPIREQAERAFRER